MFEVNMKPEIDSKLKVILNWSAGIEKYKEESKSSSVYSVPDEIMVKSLSYARFQLKL